MLRSGRNRNFKFTVNSRKSKMENFSMDSLIANFPKFDAEKHNNFQSFIKDFDELINETKISEKLKIIILKSKLSGKAKEIISDSSDLNAETDYQSFKTKLINIFKPTEDFEDAQNEFFVTKQKPSQSIEEYGRLFLKKANKYMMTSGQADKEGVKIFMDKMKLKNFLGSINPMIALDVRKMGPKSFEEAYEQAKKIEKAIKLCPEVEVNQIQSNESNLLTQSLFDIQKNYQEEINTLKRNMENLKLSDRNGQEVKKKWCFICEISSHETKNCYYNAKNKKEKVQKTQNYQMNVQRNKFDSQKYSNQRFQSLPVSPHYHPQNNTDCQHFYAQNSPNFQMQQNPPNFQMLNNSQMQQNSPNFQMQLNPSNFQMQQNQNHVHAQNFAGGQNLSLEQNYGNMHNFPSANFSQQNWEQQHRNMHNFPSANFSQQNLEYRNPNRNNQNKNAYRQNKYFPKKPHTQTFQGNE